MSWNDKFPPPSSAILLAGEEWEEILSEQMSQAPVAPIQAAAAGSPAPAAAVAPKPGINTAALVAAMVSTKGASDLIFSPGRPPQVELNGVLRGVKIEGLPMLLPDHTAKIAQDMIGSNKQALQTLKEDGSCDLSYSLPAAGPLSRQHF